MPDFDRLRATASSEKQFLCRLETSMLRATVARLSVGGQCTHGALTDILQPQIWTYLVNVAGWLDDGLIGQALNALQERLTGIQDMWDEFLSAICAEVASYYRELQIGTLLHPG